MGKPDSITICQFGFLRKELNNLPPTLTLTNRGQYATRVTSAFDATWNELDLHGPLIIHARAFTTGEGFSWLEGEPAPRELHAYHDEGAILVIPENFSEILTKPIPPYVYAYCVINEQSWDTVLNKLCPMQEKVANSTRKIVKDITGATCSRTWHNYGHRLEQLHEMLNNTVEIRAHIDECPICKQIFSIAVNRPPGV